MDCGQTAGGGKIRGIPRCPWPFGGGGGGGGGSGGSGLFHCLVFTTIVGLLLGFFAFFKFLQVFFQ
jgi:hypothetical protein